jgi:hypothetical protein
VAAEANALAEGAVNGAVAGAKRSQLRMVVIFDSHEPREHPRDATELVRVELHCLHEITRPMLHLEQILEKNPEAAP